MRDVAISEKDAGQRLDKFLKKYFRDAGAGFIYKMLRKKNIVLNGRKASGSERISASDTITLFMSDNTIEKFKGGRRLGGRDIGGIEIDAENRRITYNDYHIDILYEDEYLIFFNKPAGLLSQKAESGDVSMAEILETYLRKTGQISDSDVQKPGISGRLDRNTSGILPCGKNLKGSRALAEAVRERRVSKYYRCIVEGVPESGAALSGYLIKDEKENKAYVSDNGSGGKYIRTEFEVIRPFKDKALVEARLITGRTHQIRAHLAYNGFPLAGDVKYGAARDGALKHYLLHAYALKFGNEGGALSGVSEKTIRAPLPKDFKRYMDSLT